LSKNTPPKPIALFDMDGTGADFHSAMERDLKKLMGPGEEPLLTAEDEEKYPHIKERRRLIKNQPEWWFNLETLPRGFRVLAMLRELGYRITVLTRGPKGISAAWSEKVRWCQKHIPDARVTVTSDEKGRVYGRVLVDDWVPYIEPWLKRRPRGLVILPDQPWNQGFSHPQVVRHTENDDEVRKLLIEQRERPLLPRDDEED